MQIPNFPCKILRSVAGLAMVGTGLFHLFTLILSATEQLRITLDRTEVARTQMLSLIVIASSLNIHDMGHDLLRVLWPLLPSTVGSILLFSVYRHRNERESQPCAQWV
jgi:hypothetical protein